MSENSATDYAISGIQQIGIGVPDKTSAWTWYRRHFNMDVPVFQEAAEAPLMTRYTGGEIQSRDAALAVNMAGGGGFEIWQYTSRVPQLPSFQPALGDLGILCVRIKAPDVTLVERRLRQSGAMLLGGRVTDPAGNASLFVTDVGGNIFQIVETADGWFSSVRASGTGGVAGALIGVSDVARARALYSDVLGYDSVLYDESGQFADLAVLPGGDSRVRRVALTHGRPRQGAFAPLLGPTVIELVQALETPGRRLFADRYWGDQGFIHLCLDVIGMDGLKQRAAVAGFPFTVDSGDTFDMGEAGGRFAYLEDPDGTLIEFVETHKVPLLKALGWYIDLRKRNPRRPLPRWMIKAMGLTRVKE